MHAVEMIAAGEVVAVKGGHIVDGSAVASLPETIRNSAFPIAADRFLAALTYGEYDGVMMRVNHSCEPNVGIGGNVLLVAMRDIAAGEAAQSSCVVPGHHVTACQIDVVMTPADRRYRWPQMYPSRSPHGLFAVL